MGKAILVCGKIGSGKTTYANPAGEELVNDSKHEPIKVRRHGTTGPVVTVLHGGPGAPGCAVGLAKALAPFFVVNEPLQRRSGEFPLTVESHIRDLAQITPGNAILIGHSWGAMLTLSFAATHPDRVSKIFLVGCGTYDNKSRILMKRRLSELMDEGTRLRIDGLRRLLNEESDPKKCDSIWRELGELYMKVETYDPIDDPEYLHEEVEMDSIGNKETWEDVLRLQREGGEPDRFSRITCPVIMLHGTHDPHPGRETAELLRGYIPQLEYVEFEKCGHEPWRERHCREDFLAKLRKYIIHGPS